MATALHAAPAVADVCENPQNCHAIAVWPAGNINGGTDQIYSQCLYLPSGRYSTDFVNNELWLAMQKGAYWTEAGMSIGHFYDTNPPSTYTYPVLFYADQRPPGSSNYHEHVLGPASLGTWYGDYINYAGGGSYNVQLGGGGSYYSVYSTNQYYPANLLETGTEASTQYAHNVAAEYYLGWYDTSNTSRWPWGANTALQVDESAPEYVSWVSTDWELDSGINSC